jgi:chromate transporter
MKAQDLYLLLHMAWEIMFISLFAFGGLAPVLPELHQVMVKKYHWIGVEQFTDAYTLSVVAPGPNSIFIFSLGYHIAGFLGAVVGIIAWAIPGCLTVYFIGRWGNTIQRLRMGNIRQALVPCVTGFLLASALVTARSFDEAWIVPQSTLSCMAFVVLVLKPKLNPLWIVVTCGLLGTIF